MKRRAALAALACLLAGATVPAAAQAQASRWSSSKSLSFGRVDRSTLNNHFEIPIYSRATLGHAQINLRLTYDSQFWGTPAGGYGYWEPGGFGWRLVQPYGELNEQQGESDEYCGSWNDTNEDYDEWWNLVYTSYTFTEPDGTVIETGLPYNQYLVYGGGSIQPGDEDDCPYFAPEGTITYTIPDGKGYSVALYESNTASAYAAAFDANNDEIDGEFKDRNGNLVTVSSSGGDTHYSDPLGTALTESGAGTSSSPIYFSYTGPNLEATTIEEQFTDISVSTDFMCDHYVEWSGTATVPSELDLPDGTKYTFGYDSIARLISVTLPTGATIHYSYTLDCSDDGNSGLTRWDSVNGSGHGWSWARSQEGGGAVQTVETDPEGNDGVYNFAAPAWTGEDGALTSAALYNGSHSSGTEMESETLTDTLTHAYVDQQTTALEVFGTTPVYKETVADYDIFGNSTTVTDYNWGTSSPSGGILRQTTTDYTVVGGVFDEPTSVTVSDGSNTAAKTAFTYDGSGNPLTVKQYINATTSLTTTYTYNSNGNLATAEDPNGQTTTYSYVLADGCGASGDVVFPTEVEGPTGLTTNMTWNCTGGVLEASKDANSNTTTYTYGDPANTWRPTAVEDAGGTTTTTTYPTGEAPDQSESAMTFNAGNSVNDVVTTVDGLGRPILRQKHEGPSASNWDGVQTSYDAMDRPSTVSMPYVTTTEGSGGTAPGGTAVTTTSYDALSRESGITDGGGGTVSYTYSGNDVLQTVGPAPGSENAKKKQMEYDGLGRLSSVCEVVTNTGDGTPTPGSGTCGQTYTANGYWTQYTRNGLGQITEVRQNAQGSPTETRSFGYDWLGRMTGETNPESGSTGYYFDSSSTCGLSSAGDLVERGDANGNVTCYAHDALHRVTAISYPSGPNASATPTKYFTYDAATYSGNGMANAEGRLARAYTGAGATTDLYFSYTPLGQVAETWQASPHSDGYSTTTASYYGNGALAALGAPGAPAISYGVDGEGRPATATAAGTPPQPLVSASTYTPLGLTALTLGSSDSDGYSYDAETGRMTQYVFTVDGATDTGALTWNANGSLGTLAITDDISGTSDSQSCGYTRDDLGRIAAVACTGGSDWSQTFTYDAFGNLTKSGSVSFGGADAYGSSNRIVVNSSFYPNYDSDGNLEDDPVSATRSVNSFDAEGKAVTLEGVGVTYDALGRAVEAAEAGGTIEFVYGPGGGKLAVMSGQTLERADIPLPGGGEAVYNGSGLAYYRHADHLGSSRLASTPHQALYASTAYAPYGEAYAETQGAGGAVDRSFTGQKQDISGGQYDFLMRELSSTQSRWWTPDPAGLAAVDPNNPQTWNRYAYVGGMPLALIDHWGLQPCAAKLELKRDATASGDDATSFGPYAADSSDAAAEDGADDGGCQGVGGAEQCTLDGMDIDCGLGWDLFGGGAAGPGGAGSDAGSVSACAWYACAPTSTGADGNPHTWQWQFGPTSSSTGNPYIDPSSGMLTFPQTTQFGYTWTDMGAAGSCGLDPFCYFFTGIASAGVNDNPLGVVQSAAVAAAPTAAVVGGVVAYAYAPAAVDWSLAFGRQTLYNPAVLACAEEFISGLMPSAASPTPCGVAGTVAVAIGAIYGWTKSH